ncbi:energy transducer TonB [Campylobacter volucris]|uniref:energy transducer TonB family protein n=1 Tax=Campylobacter volucris TaxID=1031542 RepID=UPI00189E7D08|nr:energy transducer TonB [Campylobacter volucris]MBF7067162.1 energy transducer TonB [Campylobacter volucris]
MKNIFNHHKIQSFVITLIFFTPLIFIFIYSKNFLLVKQNTQENHTFNLQFEQFLQQIPSLENKQQENITKPIQKQEKTQKTIQKKLTTKTKSNSKPLLPSQANSNTPLENNLNSHQEENLNSPLNDELLKEIKFAIDKALVYPRQAQKMRMSGEILLEFTWTKDQVLQNLKIIKASKYEILNKSALQTIQSASKKFPKYEKTFHIRIPIIYKIN